jgi:hypothetical protein
MKEHIEQQLKNVEEQIIKESSYNRIQCLLDDRNVILYLLSFFI